MTTDRSRYDDEEEVWCRTCGEAFRHPSPVHWGQHFGAHHPSCRVPRKIRCGATVGENSDGSVNVCGSDASFWDKVNDDCCCDTHQEGLSDLQPITAMTKEVVANVLARQRIELG
jgi:hypothetical protein